ncbi:galactokinase [Reinekea marinisedimentorum]|uniref:Galactokinase n=1 Tax=Reinekea marinisedimentorum TaxID=230495 RepID=A0A4R3I7G0_9GAMM|nr:galactokinase [Reinekea marinisedimentorum]TCS42095.1 galactokinase [Reinekea marinisedimentorum]
MSGQEKTLQQQATESFTSHFGYPPSHSFHAPGRVNLIGEHTDYNDGFVLPAAIDFGTTVVASQRSDSKIRACAVNFDQQIAQFDLNEEITHSDDGWSNYLRGVADQLLKAGFKLAGADLAIVGDVPYGAGLSSSAALEVVLIRALLELCDSSIDPTQAALLGQKTENEFIGAQTGIMDQLIIAHGKKDHAVLIDCRSLTTQPVPLDADFKIVIFHSNVKRGLVDSEYNTRRLSCQAAADKLAISHLRDATMDMLDNIKGEIDEVIYRRARHVITENERTLEAADALKARDWQTLGRLMAESHTSMKDDFEITVPPIDGLVSLIQEKIGRHGGGARMTGGGFGGCVVSLVHNSQVDEVIAHVKANYQAKFGIKETVYICQAVDGAFA